MVEKIYETIRGILYDQFPKNNQGIPTVYDRPILNWYFGDRKLLPSPLGIIMKGTTANIKDIGFGLREIEYSIGIQFYSSNDDQETTERVIEEAARLTHSILKNHRSMWICDLCPFCGKLPLSPIHYIDTGIVTNVQVLPSTNTGGIVTVSGDTGDAFISVKQNISGLYYNVADILSCGLGIAATSYSSGGIHLNLSLSKGSGHSSGVSTVMFNYVSNVTNKIQNYWQETHVSSSPPYYDWAGIGYQSITEFIQDYKSGYDNGTNGTFFSSLSDYYSNLNSVVINNINLVRLLQDIQVSDIKPSDDATDQMFLRSAEFTLKAKEITSVDTFGPNNVNVNAI